MGQEEQKGDELVWSTASQTADCSHVAVQSDRFHGAGAALDRSIPIVAIDPQRAVIAPLLPSELPVREGELEVIETYLGRALDELLGGAR